MSSFSTVLRSVRGPRGARVVTLVVVVAGVAGVAISGVPERADTAIQPTVHRDAATWAMPLDGYVTPASDLMDQAEDLGQESCLADAGVVWDVPHRDPDALIVLSGTRNAPARGNASPSLASTRPLDASTAADRGYHGASTAGLNEAAWKRWAFDPARNTVNPDVFATCLSQARSRLGTRPAEGGTQQAASSTALRLTYVAAVEARSDARVVQAAGRWRQCMTKGGVHGVAGAPSGMPTRALRDRFGAVIAGTPVSDVEKSVATRDVDCQESSGYRGALYDAEWNRLGHVTASDAATLSRARTDMPELTDRLRSDVASLQR